MIDDPTFYFAAVPAILLYGIAKGGFASGFGIVAVPMMALVVPPAQAAAIMLPILLLMDAMGLVAFRGRFDAAILRIAVPAGLVGIAVGWLLFRHLDERWIRALIGTEAVIFALQKLLEGAAAWRGPPVPLRRGPALFWSALSGFTSFVSHAGGPPMMQLMMPLKLRHEIFVGTLAWFFAAINFSKILPYAQLGLLDPANLGTSLLLIPAVPVGYLLGLRFLKLVSPGVFVRVASVGLLLTGVKLLWDAFAA